MNSKRAANRTKSARIAHREPEHHERGFKRRMTEHRDYGSPAPSGAYVGAGHVPGTDQLPAIGPGAAASQYAGRDPGETPMAPAASGATPPGMPVYDQE